MQLKIVAVWLALGFAALVKVSKQHVEIQGGDYEVINYGNFKEFLNHTLNVSQVLASIYVEDFVECTFQCIATLGCFSFNIATVSSINPNNRSCDLLSTDKYYNSSNFVPSQEFDHYAIASPCESFPCQNDGKCRTLYKENTYVCDCRAGFIGNHCEKVYKNCAEVYQSGYNISGVYKIDPDGLGQFQVFCDQKTAGGGWTVFQRRQDGSVDFYRGWDNYKKGFGNLLNGEFWLGLEEIHRLTASSSDKLRVDLEDINNKTSFAEYSSFDVASESFKYQLSLGQFSGTTGDSLSYHNGSSFTTKDRDNDNYSGNCAQYSKGAWWYNSCFHSDLNNNVMRWNIKPSSLSNDIKRSEMKIRPKDF